MSLVCCQRDLKLGLKGSGSLPLYWFFPLHPRALANPEIMIKNDSEFKLYPSPSLDNYMGAINLNEAQLGDFELSSANEKHEHRRPWCHRTRHPTPMHYTHTCASRCRISSPLCLSLSHARRHCDTARTWTHKET